MNRGAGRFISTLLYIVAAAIVVIGVVVSFQVNTTITETNRLVDIQISEVSPYGDDAPIDTKQSNALAWIPFLVGLVTGLILTAAGLVVSYTNEIKNRLTPETA